MNGPAFGGREEGRMETSTRQHDRRIAAEEYVPDLYFQCGERADEGEIR